MSITGNIDLLQAINATVTGVGSAPIWDNYPISDLQASVDAGDLTFPIVLTFHGDGQSWEARSATEYSITRQYDIFCYARMVYQEDFITGKKLAAPILDAMGKKYLNPTTYTLGNYTLTCTAGRVRVMPNLPIIDQNESNRWMPLFGGVPYHGFKFSLSLMETGSF